MIIIGVLILFGCFTSLASSSRCVDFIERMYERKLNQDFTQLTQEESNFIEYSATSQTVPAFGNKPQCDKHKESKYLVALRIFRPHEYQYRAGFAHGACLPAYCADPKVDPGIPTNDTLMRHLFFAGGWFLDTITLYEEQYRLLDPDNWDLPPFFYPTLLLVLSFIAWSVYSTVQLHKRQNNESIALNERGGKSQWLMEAFDLKKNALQLYQTAAEQGLNEDLAVFQFLRAGSCYWVAYYHVSLFNIIFIVNYWTSTENLWIRGSPFDWLMSTDGVENFYFMGGFFAVYTMVAKLSVSFKFKTLWELLKHRFIRICPVYMIAVLFFSQVGPYLSSEPGMVIYQTEAIQCYSIPSMIAKAFFLDVLLNRFLLPTTGGFCMGSTYYIGVEFPIQAFAILVIAVYAKYRKSGRLLFLGLILQSAVLTNYNFHKYNGFSGDNLYLWERKHLHNPCGIWYTFFNGAFWGALYHEYSRLKKKNIFYIFEKYPKIGYLSTLIGFIITVDIRAFWLYKWYTISWSVFPVIRSIIYSTTLALFYGPLITTRPNALKRFLNHRVFQIVGKTSFLFYLSQDWVIRNLLMGTHTMRYYHFIIVLLLGIAALILTQIVAIVFHLTIEKPLLNIEMRLTKKAKSPIKADSNQRKAANSASYAEMVDEKEMEIELSADKDTQGMEDKEDDS